MRNYLLAGCAGLALTLGFGPANADDQVPAGKFQVLVGGDAYFEAGAVSQDRNTNLNSVDFRNRFRLVVTPSATADNGMQYGARIRIRANNSDGTTDADRAFIFVQGVFGRVEAGEVNSPNDQAAEVAQMGGHPMDYQMLNRWDAFKAWLPAGRTGSQSSANSGFVAPGTISTSTPGSSGKGVVPLAFTQWGAGDAWSGYSAFTALDYSTRFSYFTPRVLGSSPTTGLQGTVSFQPWTGYGSETSTTMDVATAISRNPYMSASPGSINTTSLFNARFQNVYEVGANYTDTYANGVKLQGTVAYTGGSAQEDNAGVDRSGRYYDLQAVQVGGNIGYAGFTFGGGYQWAGKSGYTKAPYVNAAGSEKSETKLPGYVSAHPDDQYAWNIGGQYVTGPVAIGTHFLEEVDAGNLAYSGSRTLDAVTAGAMYTVAPGLQTGVEGTYFWAHSDVPASANSGASTSDSGSVWLLRSVVTF